MKISVITVNRNNAEGLKKTIESVVLQTVPVHEFIIIDGASSDESVTVIKEYADKITYWISEPDKGIYNAMNKGITKATGEWCIFMNSGDCFSNVSVIDSIIKSGATADIICGNTVFQTNPVSKKTHPQEITLNYLFDTTINHQSAFIRLDLLRKHPYDEKLRIVSDRKFFLQTLILDNCSYKSLDIDIADYDITGYSAQNRLATRLEFDSVLEELIPLRIRQDYGLQKQGVLYGDRNYEKMFYEIGLRRFREPIYILVNRLLRFLSIIFPQSRFIREFSLDKSEI